MYTKKKYSIKDMLFWTRWELLTFTLYASVTTVLFATLDFHWLRLPWTPIALIGTALAFLIGFQSNAAYDRIWEARKIWGAIVNDSRTFGMMVKDMVTNEYCAAKVSDEELRAHKITIIHRHIAWMTALRYALRQKRSWETFLSYKTNREWHDRMFIPERDILIEDELGKLLSDEELKSIQTKTNKAAAILWLQSAHLRKLKEKGLIWEFSFLELEHAIGKLFDHQGKSERIKNFPYPRQFATIGFDLVKIFVVLVPFGIIPEFFDIGETLIGDYPTVGQYFVWLSIPFSVIVSWVFTTMQRIGIVGENPFEGSANDVPISTIARGIEIDLREMMEEEKIEIPDQYPTVYDIQM